MPTTSLLALHAGSREFGFAHFQGQHLRDVGVQSLRRRGTDRLIVLDHLIERLRARTQPTAFVVVTPCVEGAETHPVVAGMLTIGRRSRVPTYTLTPDTILSALTGDPRASRGMLAKAVCARLPQLQAYQYRPLAWQERYFQHLFLAVACGLAFLRKTAVPTDPDHAD